MVQYMLLHAKPKVAVEKLHGHDMLNKNIDSFGHECVLLMILRNYKECIMSHLSRHGNEHKPERIELAYTHYAKILSVYWNTRVPKILFYYEDIITQPVKYIQQIAEYFGTDVSHIVADMNGYLTRSRESYMGALGNCQTDGKQTIHFTPLTKEYDFDWDQRMRDTAPGLYDEYLTRYGETND